MRSIDITRAHSLTHAQALDLVQAIADDIAEQYGASYEWVGEVLRFERSGIKGAVHILPKQVHIRAELGFLLAPLRSTIEAHIIQFLDEHAGSSDPKKTHAALRRLAGHTMGDGDAAKEKPAKKATKKTGSTKSATKSAKSDKAGAKKAAKKTSKSSGKA